MFTWNVKEMKLTNAKLLENGVWEFENEVSREDKLAFVDGRTGGRISKILELADRYAKEKEQLPHDNSGRVEMASLQAWLNRNDKDRLFYSQIKIGQTNPYDRHIDNLNRREYYYEKHGDFVDYVFHEELSKCLYEETKYFNEHDEYAVLFKKVYKILNEDEKIWNGLWNGLSKKGIELSISSESIKIYNEKDNGTNLERKATIEELEAILDYVEDVEKYMKERVEKLNISYDRPLGINDKTKDDDAR